MNNNRLTGYKRSRGNMQKYNSKSIARGKLYDFGTRANVRLANNTLRVGGWAPLTVNSKERKVFDMGDQLGVVGTVWQANLSTVGIVKPIFIPKQGADFNQRIGRKTIARSLYLKWTCSPYLFDNPLLFEEEKRNLPPTQARIMVVTDSTPNGVLPTMSDILQPVGAGTPGPDSFINMNNRDRFKILMDKRHIFGACTANPQGAEGVAPFVNNFLGNGGPWIGKKYLKLNVETIFNGTSTGGIADISTGAIYLLVFGTENAGEGDVYYANLAINTRIRYDDA